METLENMKRNRIKSPLLTANSLGLFVWKFYKKIAHFKQLGWKKMFVAIARRSASYDKECAIKILIQQVVAADIESTFKHEGMLHTLTRRLSARIHFH